MKNVDEHGLTQLKQIIQDVLGSIASEVLLSRVHAVLDEGSKDAASLKQACGKIEKIVGLFIGADHAQILANRFAQVLK